jgi:hypothetical protein
MFVARVEVFGDLLDGGGDTKERTLDDEKTFCGEGEDRGSEGEGARGFMLDLGEERVGGSGEWSGKDGGEDETQRERGLSAFGFVRVRLLFHLHVARDNGQAVQSS